MSDIGINANSGERLSFYQLFDEKNMQVEIPIIQRDYAQGRESEAEVRNTFLSALHDYLDKGDPFRDLDFVYGSVTVHANSRPRFIPLDGQQRLTTLFLLHWYLAQIARKGESFRQVLSSNGLSLFTYETRSSSREFCNALVANDIDFTSLLMESGSESLAQTIKDQAWFFLSWGGDPTIRSMLTMLDAIHVRFKGCTDFFEKLVNCERPVVTFRFLNLAQFKLTDDLYIKMNARGKPLTDFENFKARLEKAIKSFKGEWPDYQLSFKKAPVSGYEYFIHKIDTDWADLFWAYRNVATKDNTYDDELMNFLALVIANSQLIQNRDGSYNLLRHLLGIGGKLNRLSVMEYEQLGCLSQESIVELIESLDLLCGARVSEGRLMRYLDKNLYYDEEATFKKVVSNSSSFPEKLRFYAFYSGLANGKKEQELLSWMRIIFNLTENTIINSAEEYRRALLAIRDLVQKNDSILNLLRHDVNIKFFSEVQVFEEKLKAHLILKSPDWESTIFKLENHVFFRGQIGFVLKFSGIVDYFSEYKDVSWAEDSKCYSERFNRYADSAAAVFSAIGQSSKVLNYAWERAVLSKGDYFTTTSANRYNLLSSRLNKNNIERDHSWRRLLRLSLDAHSVWSQRQEYVKAVLDDSDFDIENVESGLEAICSKASKKTGKDDMDWRAMLIAKPELFALCNQGFIVRSADEVVLLHESQRNHYHSELYSKYLALELKDREVDITPFTRMDYISVRSGEDCSYLSISGFFIAEQEFSVAIWLESGQYYVQFSREHDESIPPPNNIQDILNVCGFTVITDLEEYKSENWEGCEGQFLYKCEKPKGTLNKMSELCNLLRELGDE